MKKSYLSILFILALSPFLVQCASQDELNQIHYQLRMLNKKVNELETGTIDNLMKRQASSSSQVDQLYQEFLQLKSELEEAGHLNRRLTEQNKELEIAFKSYTETEEEKRKRELLRLEEEIIRKDQSIDNLAQQLKIQQENLKAIQQARVEEAKRKAEAAAQAAAAARAKADAVNNRTSSPARIRADKKKKLYSGSNSPVPSEAPPTVKAVSSQPSPQRTEAVSSSNNADVLFSKGKYREAYQAFEEIIRNKPNSEESIAARFMMGESLFALQEYDQAILEYQNIITNNAANAKAPAAMLRQAMAFQKLNDNDTAKILFQKLIAAYKNSPEAAQAEQMLQQL